MKETQEQFLASSSIKAADREHRRKINFNIGKYNAVVPKGKQQFMDVELAREMAKNAKWKAIATLDKQLELFESIISSRGAKVIWAEDVTQAQEAIGKICKEKKCKTLVKSKSMVTEEIHLNDFLEASGIESVETDLGEYIQQLDGEPPYHIVTPAMHKSKEDVAKLFANKLGTKPDLTPEELTQVARIKLREKYTEAEVGVTGANFLIADIGGIAITENEGNGRLSCAWPKTHIAVVGIEKMILFRNAYFNNSSFKYCNFNGPQNAIQLADEASGAEDSPKNSGTLTIENSNFISSGILTKGWQNYAGLNINNSTFSNCIITNF